MSRMRQVPVMDVTQRERAINQDLLHNQNLTHNQNPAHPAMRPTAPTCRVRPRKSPVGKFRLSDTPALMSSGCSSVREFCNSVQSITVDLNNLIGSVESILPLLTTYLTALQARNMPNEPQSAEPPIDVTATNRVEEPQPQPAPHAPAAPTAPAAPAAAATPVQPSAMPRPEDLQQLLENPLVKNLLTSFIQNAPH